MTPAPPPAGSTEGDPLGHTLLRARQAAILGTACSLLADPPPPASPRAALARRFVVTGTGSSEAHARFLVHLVNHHTGHAAEFAPLSGFLHATSSWCAGATLIVFSQGLSPNAQTAFRRRREFTHLVVFTATTSPGALAAGKGDRAALIEQLHSEGADFVLFPIEEEYTTLIRLIGPFCAYLAAWCWVASLPGARLQAPQPELLADLASDVDDAHLLAAFESHADAWRRGFYIVASAPLVEFAHNLSFKVIEGLFWSAPMLWDYLAFAHGPFQEVSLNPRPVMLLHGPGDTEADLADRACRMLADAGLQVCEVPTRHASLAAILDLELRFNDLILTLIERNRVDQVNWPSKGRDDPLYGFARI